MQCLYIQDAVLLNLHCQELSSKMVILEKGVLKSKCYKKESKLLHNGFQLTSTKY